MNLSPSIRKLLLWYGVAIVIIAIFWTAPSFLYNREQNPVGVTESWDSFGKYYWTRYSSGAGFILTALSAIFALFAWLGSRDNEATLKRNQEDLLDYGISVEATSSKFSDIFQNHLISPLQSHEDKPKYIHLMISSPAYGYSVLGAEKARDFIYALRDVTKGSQVEVILPTTEAHWVYWANTLLYSYIRESRDHQIDFALDFAKVIVEAYTVFKRKSPTNHDVWISDLGQQRLFAFTIMPAETEAEQAKIVDPSPSRVYFINTDRIELALDQWKENFYARSHRVFKAHISDHILSPNSIFERTKHCPYTQFSNIGRVTDLGKVASPDELLLLFSDYIFGRTGTTQGHYLRSTERSRTTAEILKITQIIYRGAFDPTSKITFRMYLLNTLRMIFIYFQRVKAEAETEMNLRINLDQVEEIIAIANDLMGDEAPPVQDGEIIDILCYNLEAAGDFISRLLKSNAADPPDDHVSLLIARLLMSGQTRSLYFEKRRSNVPADPAQFAYKHGDSNASSSGASE